MVFYTFLWMPAWARAVGQWDLGSHAWIKLFLAQPYRTPIAACRGKKQSGSLVEMPHIVPERPLAVGERRVLSLLLGSVLWAPIPGMWESRALTKEEEVWLCGEGTSKEPSRAFLSRLCFSEGPSSFLVLSSVWPFWAVKKQESYRGNKLYEMRVYPFHIWCSVIFE